MNLLQIKFVAFLFLGFLCRWKRSYRLALERWACDGHLCSPGISVGLNVTMFNPNMFSQSLCPALLVVLHVVSRSIGSQELSTQEAMLLSSVIQCLGGGGGGGGGFGSY